KGGLFLELLSAVDTVVFDKTGTLTHGAPKVVALNSLGNASQEELLSLAAVAESVSEHPLGKAIIARAQQDGLTLGSPKEFSYVPGKGIKCTIEGEEVLIGNRGLFEQNGYALAALKEERTDTSEVIVGRSGQLLGIIHIAGILRAEAKDAVNDL